MNGSKLGRMSENKTRAGMSIGIDIGSTTAKVVLLEGDKVVYEKYERHFSQVREKTKEMLAEVRDLVGDGELTVAISGSAGLGMAENAGILN